MKFYIAAVLMLGRLSQVHSHGTKVMHCVTPESSLRIFIEHWHGASTTAANAGTMQIRENHILGSPVTTISPTGAIAGTQSESLPGCIPGTLEADTACSDNMSYTNPDYNDWVWYDFDIICETPVNYTLEGGDSVTLADGCGSLYPVSIASEGFVCPASDSDEPSVLPTAEPSVLPTYEPTVLPTPEPTVLPTDEPSVLPTDEPSLLPSASSVPSVLPSVSSFPSCSPSKAPSATKMPKSTKSEHSHCAKSSKGSKAPKAGVMAEFVVLEEGMK